MKEKISVIVPVYNLENEIKKCLMSLVFQKCSNYEVIVVDDGSSDGTAEVLDSYQKKFDVIEVFHTKNGGLSSARNFGVRKASGEYIAFIDGDDYVDPQFLSILYQTIKRDGADIAVCGFADMKKIIQYHSSKKDFCLSGKDATIRLLTKQDNLEIVAWNKLYKKSFFDKIKYPKGEIYEDTLTTYKLFSTAEKVSYTSEVLYNHTFRAESIMGSSETTKRLNAKLTAAKNSINEFKNDAELSSAANYSLLLSYFQFIDYSARNEIGEKYFLSFRKKILKDKKSFLKNPYCDAKRRLYIFLLRLFNGKIYRLFRHF